MPKENNSDETFSEKEDSQKLGENLIESETENLNSLGEGKESTKSNFPENNEDNFPLEFPLENQTLNEDIALKASNIEKILSQQIEVDDGHSKHHFEDISSNDFLKDPEDFTDVAADIRKGKKLKTIGLLVLGALVIGGVATLGYNFFVSGIDEADINENKQIEQNIDNESEPKVIKPNLPLAAAYSNSPKTKAGELEIKSLKKDILRLSNNTELTISGYTLAKTQTECIVALPSDFCLAARGEQKLLEDATVDSNTENPSTENSNNTEDTEVDINENESNSTVNNQTASKVNIYLLKDATNSRLMQDPENFQKVEVAGSQVAGTMEITLAGKETPVLAIVNKDNSGFLITPDTGATKETIQEIVAIAKVSSK